MNRRQCKDYLFQAFEWGVFMGIITGINISQARYGQAYIRRRIFWNGVAFSCLWAPALTIMVYFVCPMCQP